MFKSQFVNSFPPPPEYWRQYSAEHLRTGLAPRPPPVPTKFRVYGEAYDMEGPLFPSLSDVGQQQLYSVHASSKDELKKLNSCPDSPDREEKLETLKKLFININHLINEYRPLQARSALREMIIYQNQEIKNVTEILQNYISLGKSALKILKNLQDTVQLDDIPALPKSYTTALLPHSSPNLDDSANESSLNLQLQKIRINSEEIEEFMEAEKIFFNYYVNTE